MTACTKIQHLGNYIVHYILQVGKDKARPALTLVGYEDEIRPAMAYVFGSTFICDTMLDAKKVLMVLTLTLILSWCDSDTSEQCFSLTFLISR